MQNQTPKPCPPQAAPENSGWQALDKSPTPAMGAFQGLACYIIFSSFIFLHGPHMAAALADHLQLWRFVDFAVFTRTLLFFELYLPFLLALTFLAAIYRLPNLNPKSFWGRLGLELLESKRRFFIGWLGLFLWPLVMVPTFFFCLSGNRFDIVINIYRYVSFARSFPLPLSSQLIIMCLSTAVLIYMTAKYIFVRHGHPAFLLVPTARYLWKVDQLDTDETESLTC